ncbi:MAG: ABC transporter substrate-binding protein, partial [Vulcanimicrobiaceae bacterium]
MRIVSLLPSATEILFAIGAGDEVVGVTHECDFPEAARRLPILTASSLPSASSSAQIDTHVRKNLHEGSGLYTLDRDLLADLDPDLIVTQELCAVCAVSYDLVSDAVKRLRSDTRVISLEPSSLHDVLETIATLGNLTNHRPEADVLIERFAIRMRSLESNVARALDDRAARGMEERPTLLLLEWSDPPMGPGH